MKRTAKAVWTGSGMEGRGNLTTQSRTLEGTPYSFKTRFEDEEGKSGTNPEELIAAAHAGCFSMALSFQLSNAGFKPDELQTEAVLQMEKEGNGWSIKTITLNLQAKVKGIEEGKFNELANEAKANCPVSKVLKADIKLNAKLNS